MGVLHGKLGLAQPAEARERRGLPDGCAPALDELLAHALQGLRPADHGVTLGRKGHEEVGQPRVEGSDEHGPRHRYLDRRRGRGAGPLDLVVYRPQDLVRRVLPERDLHERLDLVALERLFDRGEPCVLHAPVERDAIDREPGVAHEATDHLFPIEEPGEAGPQLLAVDRGGPLRRRVRRHGRNIPEPRPA
jgi:hypothetical protein